MGMMCDDDDYDYEAENEAFNIIERRQGGFQTKREMAKHKLTDEEIDETYYRAMYLKVRDELAELQQRTWVGLTDEEIKDIVWNLPYEPSQEHIRAIEAKLKEKNT